MVFCFFPSEPPESVKSKGTRGQRDALILEKQNHPHVFALGLKDAACKAPEPGCFILSACGALGGCTACWARKAVLEKYANGSGGGTGLSGYVGACCCVEPPECRGSPAALFLEGCCCPVRPDPCDYQLIACSNCLQLLACVVDIVAMFDERATELANLIDCAADCFTCSVAGCMGAQIKHEMDKDQHGVVYAVAVPTPMSASPSSLSAASAKSLPVVAVQPAAESMER
ncbi:hypothetical protein EMIHUDRAFT_215486 [Emiliania huxleyi CCMP1516]|uniref:Saposin B-type domain-containing protein n=2 Tax=Emiliania huxleyi TaxID=2903 RepID=A0A0D3IHG1_EMIH1|nr:hypothetical protein EMIHUDRAFT_215486 [Emiliania huxleyi CCMP1516]EOD10696.1 hypothetical protein EMIHUDRAFT_215486 [Emiliania huxleyi CCMP1516]|eukprot:XP_005763125.1 hypothetical protein EMIHUDRAFT_215486 [Emiliania huxleyi CCMP1516]